MKQEARRKNLPGKIWDVLYPTAALVLCMLIITMAALMLAGWITGKQSADSRELMEAVPGLSLWVSGGFYGAALLTQRKQYALDALQFDEPEKRWRAKKTAAACFLAAALGHLLSTGMEYLLGRRDSGGVFKGEDHYLLEKIESDEGDNVQDNIEAVRSFAEKNQEREIYFLVAPNAAEILQDKLPAFAVTEDQKGQLERLRASLPEQIRWIDACGALEAHRDEEIYYRTDHHWTSLGAWYAFQEAKKVMALNEAYTEKLTPRAVSDSFNGTLSARSGYERGFREPIYIYFPDGTEGTQAVVYDVEKGEKTASLYAPEKLKEKDQYAVFLGGNRPLLDIRTTSESPEKLLIFKDSYANCLIPFLVPYFRQILVVDPRYYYGDVEALIQENQIGGILFLYNGNTFFTDNSLSGVLAEQAG